MRALLPMTQEERNFAEQHHDLVIDFLRYRRLPMDEFYNVVIFGYLSAVQQYIRNPPVGVNFKAMAFRAMKDAVLRESEYRTRAKRCGVTVGLDDVELTDPRQDTERRVEGKALLEQVVNVATPREARIINANQGLKAREGGRKTAQKSRECKYVANKSHNTLLRCLRQ